MRLLPAREFPMDEAGRTKFRGRWRELFEGDPSKRRLYKDISNGVPAAGVEYYLPLFFDALATVFDYLPEAATLVLHHDVSGAVQAFWQDAQSRYKMLGGDPRPAAAAAGAAVRARRGVLHARQALPAHRPARFAARSSPTQDFSAARAAARSRSTGAPRIRSRP